jgi:hypothetical protein
MKLFLCHAGFLPNALHIGHMGAMYYCLYRLASGMGYGLLQSLSNTVKCFHWFLSSAVATSVLAREASDIFHSADSPARWSTSAISDGAKK